MAWNEERLMLNLLHRIRQWFRRKPPATDLTVVEYEAVSLIAYERRAAYERAREQAEYCLSRGSESGCRFWSEVAVEVARRIGMTNTSKTKEQSR
jgi:hypothetical protein